VKIMKLINRIGKIKKGAQKKSKTVLVSSSGKKEATIMFTTNNGYVVKIEQIINTGIGIERDLVQLRTGIKTYESANRFALKYL